MKKLKNLFLLLAIIAAIPSVSSGQQSKSPNAKPTALTKTLKKSGTVKSVDAKANTFVVTIDNKDYKISCGKNSGVPKIGSIANFEAKEGSTIICFHNCEDCKAGTSDGSGVCFMFGGDLGCVYYSLIPFLANSKK